jgi:hypothetical protein
MATTTPNYGWDVPTSTDYVKDGATAIETLGDDIDATLWTALGGAYPGLRLVKKQTIGTGVSSVTVTGAFSATYDAYKIVISGGVASTGSYLQLQLGASAASYCGGIVGYNDSTSVIVSGGMRSISSWIYAGWSGVNNIALDCTLINPFLAKYTTISGQYYTDQANSFNLAGRHEVATSYTAFTLTPVGGTLTGGTIYVYGYGAS